MPRSKPGKYDAVLPSLKPLPPADLAYQEKVQQIKDGIDNRDAVILAADYMVLRAKKDELSEKMYQLNRHIAAFEQLIAESQEAQAAGWGEYGVKDNALRLPTGETIRVQEEPYGQVKDKEAFRQWAIENGYERQLALPWQTINAIVKERLIAGNPEPDGCETFRNRKIVLVKNGGASE